MRIQNFPNTEVLGGQPEVTQQFNYDHSSTLHVLLVHFFTALQVAHTLLTIYSHIKYSTNQ